MSTDMKELVARFKAYYHEQKGTDFPTDPKAQLMEAVKAVFRSWDNPRANVYRRMNDIPYSWGTAVNVQPMVFGNLNENSGTGVAFTRDPATGEKALFGEYLINAQGEDVVAGVRTPSPIARLKEDMPAVYEQFQDIAHNLENHYRDMQDMEFTIENGKLYMLQTRNGKRTAAAALKIAVDLVDEGMISEEEAVFARGAQAARQPAAPDVRHQGAEGRQAHWLWPCRLPRALPAARWCSPLRTPPSGPRRATRSSSCAWRPPRKTSRAWPARRGILTVRGRHDLPRGGRGPRHGHLLRLRLLRDQDARRRL